MLQILTRAAFGLALSTTLCQAALSLNFSGTSGSQIMFHGSACYFEITGGNTVTGGLSPNPYGDQWQITTVGGGASGSGSAAGLFGNFTGGPWHYGEIKPASGGGEYALVTTSGGAFSIRDAANVVATGNVNWVKVTTSGSTGGLNAGATLNISGMTYAGNNTDLISLVTQASGFGSVNLTFQFASAGGLSFLSAGTEEFGSTSYSGSMTPIVPEPGTLFAGALLLVPFGVSAVRLLRKQHA